MLDASRKRYLTDTHRMREPVETLAVVRDHLPRMGITRIANLTGLDRIGLPTVMVTRPNSRSVAVALGKGLSLEAAEASGVMEAIETWHAEHIVLPVRLATYTNIRNDVRLADIDRLPKVMGAQFDPDARMLWIEGTDLTDEASRWVPYEMVDTDYTAEPLVGRHIFPRSTNGLASGNVTLEATCHAICELIERDATTLWHLGPETARIDPSTIDDPRCLEALGRFTAADIDVGIWETTSDIGVPSFRCTICETGDRPSHIGIGDGCHPDRAIALLRAMTEAAQTRLTYISGARDDLMPDEFTASALRDKWTYIRSVTDRCAPTLRFSDGPNRSTGSFEDDLDWLLARLASTGLDQVVAVDLSREDIDISVVRVVIPGLEAPHDDADYVPGPRALTVSERSA